MYDHFIRAPNDTVYTRWCCHSGMANPVQIVSTPPAPSNGGPITLFWASRPCGPTGWLAMLLIKAGDVETNPGPTTTRKQVWICDICHRQIQVRKQISISCNRIEPWVHLRCAGIRLAQYTDTWTCHLHRESKLTTHTDITPPHPPWPKPPTHAPPTPPAPPQPKHRHISHFPHVPPELVKANPNPVTHSPTHPQHLPPRPEPSTYTPSTPLTTLISSTSHALAKTPEPRVPHIYTHTSTAVTLAH